MKFQRLLRTDFILTIDVLHSHTTVLQYNKILFLVNKSKMF